ncbi:RNA-guided endonuclease IscB [Paraburkholderia azotifigens]|uniref:HNH endonuclease n=1 Tax=Paraburkholderia azotifigens TaxID=2057004 RepID=A0A5C6VV23_9BURK|nr:RNA-guided endonuclease IscB [Paraburkholderia azotifigens]TXC88800.1 HNH endonuclease [Paraburkholderia azotifigens]
MAVFVLDRRGKPLMPCNEKRARLLLARGRARVHRVMPLVIRLVDRQTGACSFQPLRLKIDPGSRVTGMALVRETDDGIAVLNLFELVHRGRKISEALTARRGFRRRRRGANLRYRPPRFLNRTRPSGWLAPSLMHRVHITIACVNRVRRWAPVTALSSELVRFDMQALANPEISGIMYQQGTLAGYEVREYLLGKWSHTCIYCDATGRPLQIEHLTAKARNGSNRIGNLGLACGQCNQDKGALDVREYVKDPKRLARILATASRPLNDAAAVNATRRALASALQITGLPLELASGGQTKFNRVTRNIPKTHALDAVCVGQVNVVRGWQRPSLTIRATGRGSYQRTRLTRYGFPRGYLMRQKQVQCFQTGDHVRADVPCGRKAGIHIGRVAVRATGSFNIQTATTVVQGISYRYCTLVQRGDGYAYSLKPRNSFRQEDAGDGHPSHVALSLPSKNAGVAGRLS